MINILKKISMPLMVLMMIFLVSTGGKAVYVSNSIINNYSFDLENEETFTSFTTFDIDVEKRFDSRLLYLNPEMTYNYTDNEGNINLDEGYIDLYFTDFDLRIGKQMVTWGKADGLVVTNFVNPEDYTQYPVIEYEDRFKSINSIKLNYFLGSDSLEAIWIPEFEPVTIDERLFNNRIKQITQSQDPEIDYSDKKIDTSLENSELAIKYSSLGKDFDYELVAGYLWDDHPTIYIQPQSSRDPKVKLEHERLTVGGGSFSTSQDAWVIRGEGLFTYGKKYTGMNPEFENGVVEKNNIKWMIGTDYNIDDYLLSMQLLQEKILDYNKSIIQDEFSTQMTFMTQRQFLRDKLDTQITLFYNFNQDSLKIKPELTYDYSDNFKIESGADYMIKEGSGIVSGPDDVIYIQTKYMF